MSYSGLLMIVPGYLGLSVVLWLSILSLLLYLARTPAHRAILAVSRVLHNDFRMAANSVRKAEQRLAHRTKEVLLTTGREAAERIIEREFERVDAAVRHDLAQYPALQRKLNEGITLIDEDYKASLVVPPELPEWTKAIEAIANIPPSGDSGVSSILQNIHGTMVKANEKALDRYRRSIQGRHERLKPMLPHWRKVQQTLEQVDQRINSMLERSKGIDRHMDHYEEIVKGTDRAVQLLSSSSLTQFFIAAFVLAIAVGGSIINFNLIARPMQEMVGGNTYLMGFKAANIAALVIILVEIAMGLFLMEALRITRLFPVIAALDDKMRVRMVWFTGTMLFLMASVEAGLAYMRELLAQDDAALVAGLLSGDGLSKATAASSRWITTAAQMGMGFVLPFALTFVAIPLESFIHSARTVMGIAAAGLLRAFAFMLRLCGNAFRYTGGALINIYDLFIFLPLWIERQWSKSAGKTNTAVASTKG